MSRNNRDSRSCIMRKKIQNFEEYAAKARTAAELFNQKRYSEALTCFLDMARYHSKNYKVFETIGLIYLKLNNLAKADLALRKAKSLYSGKSKTKLSIKTFEEIIAGLEPLEKIESVYGERISGSDFASEQIQDESIHRLPVKMGLHYMAAGDFKKAEELLLQHKKKFFNKS
ncbi:MAG: hypothetical protein OEV66_10335 [Spirochaetia bacterium]|nr:hypothetical protein [Spirochaetia bacterium]